MNILVYVTSDQVAALDLVKTAVADKISDFDWEATSDIQDFKDRLGVFKIFASSQPCDFLVDLRWEDPSSFLKSPKKKASVWEDITVKVVPALRRVTLERKPLNISDSQLQKIFALLTDSSASFTLSHPDGFSIGVNTKGGADVNLSSSDIASMIASCWLFNARGITLRQA